MNGHSHSRTAAKFTAQITIPAFSNVYLYWLIEQGLTSHQTHYRLYRGQVFTDQMTQPTVLKHWRKIGPKDWLQSRQVHPTVLTIIQQIYSMTSICNIPTLNTCIYTGDRIICLHYKQQQQNDGSCPQSATYIITYYLTAGIILQQRPEADSTVGNDNTKWNRLNIQCVHAEMCSVYMTCPSESFIDDTGASSSCMPQLCNQTPSTLSTCRINAVNNLEMF